MKYDWLIKYKMGSPHPECYDGNRLTNQDIITSKTPPLVAIKTCVRISWKQWYNEFQIIMCTVSTKEKVIGYFCSAQS